MQADRPACTVRIRETTVVAENSITISRRRRLQNQIRLADAFEKVCGPFIGDSFKFVPARLLDHAVEISERSLACSRNDRQGITAATLSQLPARP